MQVESNGVLSVPNNYCSDLGKDKLRSPRKKYQEFNQINLLDDFNDEQVKMLI